VRTVGAHEKPTCRPRPPGKAARRRREPRPCRECHRLSGNLYTRKRAQAACPTA
jgi:hypothetical protein